MRTAADIKTDISLLGDAERLGIMRWLAEDYCPDCGADACCDCEDCVCECRRRRGREFQEMLARQGKTMEEWLAGRAPKD